MQRVVKKSHEFADAEQWDILQHVRMAPEERQQAALALRRRVYGKRPADVRASVRRR
jgi:hypothetical protein